MDAAGRINQFVEALRLHGRVDVATAAADFGTAEITVRRTLMSWSSAESHDGYVAVRST